MKTSGWVLVESSTLLDMSWASIAATPKSIEVSEAVNQENRCQYQLFMNTGTKHVPLQGSCVYFLKKEVPSLEDVKPHTQTFLFRFFGISIIPRGSIMDGDTAVPFFHIIFSPIKDMAYLTVFFRSHLRECVLIPAVPMLTTKLAEEFLIECGVFFPGQEAGFQWNATLTNNLIADIIEEPFRYVMLYDQ